MSMSEVLAAVDHVISGGGEPEEVLQGAVAAIVQCGGALWAAVLFNDEGELILGPHAGIAEPGARRQAPIVFEGARRGELAVDGLDDQALIERIALALSPYCTP